MKRARYFTKLRRSFPRLIGERVFQCGSGEMGIMWGGYDFKPEELPDIKILSRSEVAGFGINFDPTTSTIKWAKK